MFDRLFSCPKTIARHRDGPHARARERFLAHCADEGFSHSMLCKMAWQLLVVASTVDLREHRVSVEEIRCAATRPAAFCRRLKHGPRASPSSSQQLFFHVATAWLRFLGRLQKPRTEDGAFTRQITAFRQYMQCERGLSPVTIQTRCERLEWFMASLPDQRRTLHRIRAPTLVIAGAEDNVTTPDDARFIVDEVRNARYVELQAAHLSNIQAASEFTHALVQFLTGRF